MEILTTLFIWAAFGVIGYIMARNRGRDPLKGVVAGALVGFVAVIYYWIVGDVAELRIKKAKELVKLTKE